MGILDSVKQIFSEDFRQEQWKKKANDKNEIDDYIPNNEHFVIHVNPNVYLAQRGGRICIGKGPMDDTYTNQAKYVSKVLNRGHESVSEHTNAIGVLSIPVPVIHSFHTDYADMFSNMHFCHFSVKDADDIQYILLGGSARAFIHLVRECSPNNYFINQFIKPFLYHSYEKELMIPLIKLGRMEEELFQYLPDGEISEVEDKVTQVKNSKEKTDVENTAIDCDCVYEPEEQDIDHVTLIYKSPIKSIYNKVKEYGFTLKDVYKVATVSFIFHDISRTCSHQLVRHRVGISQESQRYVTHDYNKQTDFVDPMKMNYEERYKDDKFISVFKSMAEVNPFRSYAYLISNGVTKEDARAWLPSNVTTQLMMTFTYWQYAHFLYFRLDKAAQREIRECCADESSSFLFDNPNDRQDFIDLCMKQDVIDVEEKIVSNLKDEDVDEEIPADAIQNLEINNEEDAKKLIERSEELNKL